MGFSGDLTSRKLPLEMCVVGKRGVGTWGCEIMAWPIKRDRKLPSGYLVIAEKLLGVCRLQMFVGLVIVENANWIM